MRKIKQVIYGILIGLIISILIQHFTYGISDRDYNIIYQLSLIRK